MCGEHGAATEGGASRGQGTARPLPYPFHSGKGHVCPDVLASATLWPHKVVGFWCHLYLYPELVEGLPGQPGYQVSQDPADTSNVKQAKAHI